MGVFSARQQTANNKKIQVQVQGLDPAQNQKPLPADLGDKGHHRQAAGDP